MPPTRAMIYIDPIAEDLRPQIDGLKRAAMIFDEIVYVVSSGWRIREEIASDPRRYTRGPNGNLFPVFDFKPFEGGYNPLDDVIPGFVLDIRSWRPDLKETVLALREAGIASEVTGKELKELGSPKKVEQLRAAFAESDYKDDEFFLIQPSTRNRDFTFGRFELERLPSGEPPDELFYIDFPPSIDDSVTITETLYYAHATATNAVFLQPQFRQELDHRYRKYRKGVGVLKTHAPEVAASLRLNAHFGEVSFNVANAVISSKLLETKSLGELLRFRAEMDESRQRFISSDLAELDEMVADNAWSPAAKEQMKQYIERKLTTDVLNYNDRTKEIWEKLFGSTSVRLAKVTASTITSATAASLAGGFLGNVMPNATGLSVLLLGAIVGAGKQGPGFVRDLSDAIAEVRKAKRSSIAYVSRLAKLG